MTDPKSNHGEGPVVPQVTDLSVGEVDKVTKSKSDLVGREKADLEVHRTNQQFFRTEASTLQRWVFASCFSLNAGGIVGALNQSAIETEAIISFIVGLVSSIFFISLHAYQLNRMAQISQKSFHRISGRINILEDDSGEEADLTTILESQLDPFSDNLTAIQSSFGKQTIMIPVLSLLSFVCGIWLWVN